MENGRSKRLAEFVEYVHQYLSGDEKGEAQIFLERMFKGFGHKGLREAGANLESRVKKRDTGGTAFADLVWKPVVLFEMKKRGEDLSRHLPQAFDYWASLTPNRPRYVVLCNFDEFRIYDFNVDIHEPADTLALDDLPKRYGPLAFLFPTRETPQFRVDRLKLTREAADLLATCYNKLVVRSDVGHARAQRFILQMLIALFSEDIGLLPKYMVARLLDECVDPPKTFDLLGGLFRQMSSRKPAKGGRYADVPYFNGGIFVEPAPIELAPDEISQLKRAAEYDWSTISPEIFGTLFQHSMGKENRHALGAHYTAPTDIMKIVQPSIVRPWSEAIDRAETADDIRALHQRLYTLRVLDPACGSGNFLYIAYRAMKRLERQLHDKHVEISSTRRKPQGAIGFVTTKQFFGIDVIPFAVELAKVTMTIAHKLAIDELHIEERALPLDNLDNNIVCKDALIRSQPMGLDGARVAWRRPLLDASGKPVLADWPEADVIIGNPPFNGSKKMKPDLGPDYVNAIRNAHPDVPGMADYCVFWFRRAHDHAPMCTPDDPFRGRVGLVGTQNVRNNKSREGGLDYVVKSGTIVEAVDNQPWSGEANVHVSIVNWVKHQPPKTKSGRISIKLEHALALPPMRRLWSKTEYTEEMYDKIPTGKRRRRTSVVGKRGHTRKDKSYELARREVDHINSALTDQIDVSRARILKCVTRPQKSFQGVVPGYDGFVVTLAQRSRWVRENARNTAIVRPLLVGTDLLTGVGQPKRAVVDFSSLDLLGARRYAKPFAHLERHVLPAVRDKARKTKRAKSDMGGARADHLNRWWQFWNVRQDMRCVIKQLDRFIACSRVTKRPIFAFVCASVCPDGATQVFALEDDYSFGVISASAHWQWFVAKCSKLTERFRYTRQSVWDTFPWPQSPTKKQIRAVAEAGREVRRLRDEALPNIKGGLRALYRTIELPGKHPLKDAHKALDAGVLEAYGFSDKRDLLAQLLALNLDVAQRIDRGEPVTAPGVPPSYGDPADLISDDCIRA